MGACEMTSDIRHGERAVRPEPSAAKPSFFDQLRRDLGRHDLDDTTLERAVAEAARGIADVDAGALVARLKAGQGDSALRRRIAARLCLPAPHAPLAMPVQRLEHPRLALLPKLAGLRFVSRRRSLRER